MLHKPVCDNYFIIKCLLKLNMARFFLFAYQLHRACIIKCKSNLANKSRSKNCNHQPYLFIFPIMRRLCIASFDSNILHCIHLFCIYWFFVIDLFWNIVSAFIRVFDLSKQLITFENTHLPSC